MKRILFIDYRAFFFKTGAAQNTRYSPFLPLSPRVIVSLHAIAHELGFTLMTVTFDCGKPHDQETYDAVAALLKNEDVVFTDAVQGSCIDDDPAEMQPFFASAAERYRCAGYALTESCFVTDTPERCEAARAAGVSSICLQDNPCRESPLSVADWDGVYRLLRHPPRVHALERITAETAVRLTLNLDGEGKSSLKTPYGFLTHMLELLAFNAGFTLSGEISGDTHVDEHHILEDTAICLGSAVRQALGGKKGIRRYGFVLPMDESLCTMALDFSGRPLLVWDVEFKRESIGGMPTELFHHFFKSFCDHALCTLHIQVQGVNEHHKIEATFKAFGRCLRDAVARSLDTEEIPSTKGTL